MFFTFFMPPDRRIRGILFLSCLFVCLSVCLLSTLTFAITFEPLEVKTSYIWHAYSTYDALLNDIKVNDLVTLTLTFTLKIVFLNFFAAGGIVSVSQTLIFMICCIMVILQSQTILLERGGGSGGPPPENFY